MRLSSFHKPFRRRPAQRAFTMVEIALSIAVVSFALVAILGVLPLGMTVQKDNREDTLIAQEGRFWLEAIKGGARGAEDIPRYVEQITVTNRNRPIVSIDNDPVVLNARDIIALLSTPKSSTNDHTTARVRAITGLASEQGTNNPTPFRYQLRAEVVQAWPLPAAYAQTHSDTNVYAFNRVLGLNLWDIRLVLRWPVVERGGGWYVGNNRKVFRARITGASTLEKNLSRAIPPNLALRSILPNRFNEDPQ